jgi:hypothetical protein
VILPFSLFRSNNMDAIEAHDKRVLEFSIEVAREILPMFGEGRRMSDGAVFERAVLGYARPLALVMRHIDFTLKGNRAARTKGLLLTGASDLSTRNSAFVPPALELACASSVCIAYPGGVDLHNMLPDIYVRPSIAGDGSRFRNIVELMDMYWNDTVESVSRSDLLGKMENEGRDGPGDRALMNDIRLDETDPTRSHYRRCAARLNREWRREEGDNSPKWAALCRYWIAARSAVKFPETREFL